MLKSKLNENKISSIFDLNIPRKINYNNSFNKSTIGNGNNEFKSNSKNQMFRKVSKFNPYDIEFLKTTNKENKYKTGIKNHKSNNCFYITDFNDDSENKENDIRKSNILINKENKYFNSNKKCVQNLMLKFNTPKININIDNNIKNTPEYLIKIKKQKNVYFTDLKKALNNKKIKSTNYSSNGSYNHTENNYYDNKDIKIKDSSFNRKINEININRNIRKTQILPNDLKTFGKYLKLKSFLKHKNRNKEKSRDKKQKLKVNKSAHNINISNKRKYISTNDYKSEKENINDNFSNKNKEIENIGIKKNKSFIKSILYRFCCFGDE